MPTLADFLPPHHITWLNAESKEPALRELLAVLSTSRAVKDPSALQTAIFGREVLMSTGVGYGVAIPHAKIPTVESWVLALGISSAGIPYKPVIDDDPVRLIVMIAGPDSQPERYLKLLSTLMKFLKSEKGKILSSFSAEEVSRLARGYSFELASASSGPIDPVGR